MTSRQRLLVIAGLLISVVFLVLAFRDLKPLEVVTYIRNADTGLLIVAAVWYLITRLVTSLRWWFLLRTTRSMPLWDLLQLVCIGYMGNNIYPLRAGEVLRIVLLKREHDVPMMRTTTVILAERVFDGIVLLTFVVVALLSLNVGTPEVRSVVTIAAPVFGAALLVFFALALNPRLSSRILRWFTTKLPGALGGRIQALGEHVIAGLGGLRTPLDLMGTVITSYANWMLEALTFLLVAQAFGMPLDYLSILLLVGVVNLAGLIPASPGQFGVFEGFTRVVLTGIGVAVTEATAYALVVHIMIWLPVTVLGFIFLARKGLGLAAVTQTEQLVRQEE
ncbi:MAG: flippase-like domain-containing protein [Anaerolineae bacterium]|nr:flippase-like domain-containing protein [Anaerolineae bacterium]NUQ03127.1 flippase-like domain-containing protein [Anaerolineae bacterium]